MVVVACGVAEPEDAVVVEGRLSGEAADRRAARRQSAVRRRASPIRRIRPRPTGPTCVGVGSRPPSRARPTRTPTAEPRGPRAGGRQRSARTSTASATPSNAASTDSGATGPWPPATTTRRPVRSHPAHHRNQRMAVTDFATGPSRRTNTSASTGPSTSKPRIGSRAIGPTGRWAHRRAGPWPVPARP